MIGLIGPADSIRAAQQVAHQIGFTGELVPRPYDSMVDAPDLARELSDFCHVVLCTGRAPYALVTDAGDIAAEVQYISHSGADLYHCIARALLQGGGELPRVSVDTLESDLTLDAFAELGLPEPVPVDLMSSDEEGLAAVSARHRELLAAGTVSAVMSCISHVHAGLVDEGVRAWRINHTRPTLADALHRARLSDELVRSRSQELGVVIMEIDESALRQMSTFDRENLRLTVHQQLLKQAHKLSGRLTTLDDRSFLMTVTRGVLEEAIRRAKDHQRSLLSPPSLPKGRKVDVLVGAGTGPSYSYAEAGARQALEFAHQHGTAHVVFAGGEVVSATPTGRSEVRLQDTDGPVLHLASRLGVGPLSARRLMNALGRLGSDPVTAQQLAHAYGVQPRSARRLLASLVEAGLATEVGLRAHPGAGRPQTVYDVDLGNVMSDT